MPEVKKTMTLRGWGAAVLLVAAAGPAHGLSGEATQEWMERWTRKMTAEMPRRYCDTHAGEGLGWYVSPFLNGFRYGWHATGSWIWLERFVDWSDAWMNRGEKEPDGYTGWPFQDQTGLAKPAEIAADSLLGEAMCLKPAVLLAGDILATPALEKAYGVKARGYLELSERTFEKWNSRGAWREVPGGGLWVVPPFVIDRETGEWTVEYERRTTDGFSNPANKQNLIAGWLIAMHDVTGKAVYRERAEKWWRLMKSRVRRAGNGKFLVWNYWDPAGAWDYRENGSTRHWVGVHPNGGYYGIDVEGMVNAYEHGLVFTRDDIARLIATNRDYMWNGKMEGAAFKRIDGGEADPRWPDTPGVLWTALVPHDETLRKLFEANHEPDSWGGITLTPWYLAREQGKRVR